MWFIWERFLDIQKPYSLSNKYVSLIIFTEDKKGLIFKPYRPKKYKSSLCYGQLFRNHHFGFQNPLNDGRTYCRTKIVICHICKKSCEFRSFEILFFGIMCLFHNICLYTFVLDRLFMKLCISTRLCNLAKSMHIRSGHHNILQNNSRKIVIKEWKIRSHYT